MEVNKIYVGNALKVLKMFPDECIDLLVTSPPYWGHRDYISPPQIWTLDFKCQHKWKNAVRDPKRDNMVISATCDKCDAWYGELGKEPTPIMYINHLIQIFGEVRRVLKSSGSVYVNIGDSYISYGGKSKKEQLKKAKVGATRKGIQKGARYIINQADLQIPNKSLVGIPHRFFTAMIDDGWVARNDIDWVKPNAMPSSATDRFTDDKEPVYFFSKKSNDYYFEMQYEDTKPVDRWGGNVHKGLSKNVSTKTKSKKSKGVYAVQQRERKLQPVERKRQMRTTWTVKTVASKLEHIAMFPEDLVKPMIIASCPEKICTQCGTPQLKVLEKESVESKRVGASKEVKSKKANYSVRGIRAGDTRAFGYKIIKCDCNAKTKAGIVLDPFFGAGTAGLVALKTGRKFIGIEINKHYAKVALERLRPFMAKFDLRN